MLYGPNVTLSFTAFTLFAWLYLGLLPSDDGVSAVIGLTAAVCFAVFVIGCRSSFGSIRPSEAFRKYGLSTMLACATALILVKSPVGPWHGLLGYAAAALLAFLAIRLWWQAVKADQRETQKKGVTRALWRYALEDIPLAGVLLGLLTEDTSPEPA